MITEESQCHVSVPVFRGVGYVTDLRRGSESVSPEGEFLGARPRPLSGAAGASPPCHSLGVFQHGLAALGLATAPPPLGHRQGRGGEGVTATAADPTSVFELWVSRKCFFLFMLSLLFLDSHLSVVELGDVLCLLVPFAFALT